LPRICDCGRAYQTPCIHENACIRCALLRPDPAQSPRLAGIRDNLQARMTEARQQGWLGEVEGLKVSLTAATTKLAQLDAVAARRATTVDLGLPGFPQIAGSTVTTPAPSPRESKRCETVFPQVPGHRPAPGIP
jgi:hypothetical protein